MSLTACSANKFEYQANSYTPEENSLSTDSQPQEILECVYKKRSNWEHNQEQQKLQRTLRAPDLRHDEPPIAYDSEPSTEILWQHCIDESHALDNKKLPNLH